MDTKLMNTAHDLDLAAIEQRLAARYEALRKRCPSVVLQHWKYPPGPNHPDAYQPDKCNTCHGLCYVSDVTLEGLLEAGKPYGIMVWWNYDHWVVKTRLTPTSPSGYFTGATPREALMLALSAIAEVLG